MGKKETEDTNGRTQKHGRRLTHPEHGRKTKYDIAQCSPAYSGRDRQQHKPGDIHLLTRRHESSSDGESDEAEAVEQGQQYRKHGASSVNGERVCIRRSQ